MGTAGSSSSYGRPCEEWADALVELAMRPESRPPRELEEHLARCSDCGAYLRWLAPAAAVLAESVPGRTPPTGLKRRVMAEVRADAERQPAPDRSRAVLPGARLGLAGLTAALVLAAVVLAIGLGSGGDTRTLALSMATGGITGELVTEGDEGVLHLQGVKQPPEGRVYQAWLRNGQRLEPSSVFAVDREGIAEAAIPRGIENADELLVTVEPDGGASEPSTRPRLAVSLG